MNTRRGAWVVGVVVGAVLAAACAAGAGRTQDAGRPPGEVVVAAFRETAAGSFSFEVGVRADPGPATAMVDGDPEAARLVSRLRLSGRRAPDGFAVAVGDGSGAVAEFVRPRGAVLYARLDLRRLAGLAGEDAARFAALAAGLGRAPLPAPLKEPARAVLGGGWIGVSLPDDAAPSPLPLAAEVAELTRIREHVERRHGDLARFLARFVDVEEVPARRGRRFAVTLRAGELTRAARQLPGAGDTPPSGPDVGASLPATVHGVYVTVHDGVVTDVVVDLAEMVTAAGGEIPAGRAVLHARLSDHGEGASVTAPPGAPTVDLAQLAGLFLATALGGAAPPP